MEIIDQALQQRVWQRVAGSRIPAWNAQELPELISGERMNAATFHHLARLYPDHRAGQLHQLYIGQRKSVACLKGIYRVLTGEAPHLSTPVVPRLKRQDLLLRCHWQQQKNLETLQRWMSHPAFGESFRRLYQRELTQGYILTELLGRDDG